MIAGYEEHVNPTFGRFLSMTGRDLHLVHALGTTLTAADGRAFDDWVAGFGAFNLGHNPAAVIDAVREAIIALLSAISTASEPLFVKCAISRETCARFVDAVGRAVAWLEANS